MGVVGLDIDRCIIALLPLCFLSITQFSKYKMRKCVSCGQWMGHVLCLKGQSEQCVDCVVVPLQRPKLPAHPTTTQPRSSAQCTCAVCVAKSSPSHVGDACSSRASKPSENLTVSIPRRLVKLSRKSLTVSIPLKRLQHTQHKGSKVTTSRAHLQSSPVKEVKGQFSVHPIIKALSRQYPQIKVLGLIGLPLYTPRQLLNLYKPKSLLSETLVELGRVDQLVEMKPLQSKNEVKLRQPLQSEMNVQVESRQLLSSEARTRSDEGESREAYANSPLLQILYDHTVGDSPIH